jgi:hypothetical protein
MLCYVMLCYVMLCYVMLCYVMLCYVMLCYVMLGKLPIEWSAYVFLMRKLIEKVPREDYKMLFRTIATISLQWSCIARANMIGKLTTHHIGMEQDALTIIISKHKGDQEGAKVYPRHVYANPQQPEVCPFLNLGLYVFSLPWLGLGANAALFPHDDKYWSDTVRRFLSKSLTRQEQSTLGVSIDDLGTHSIRKGAASFVSSQMQGPSDTNIDLRAGWSVSGTAQQQYKFQVRSNGDHFTGRSLVGIHRTDPAFCALPPHFSIQTLSRIEENDWEAMTGRLYSQVPAGLKKALPFLFASVCYHIDWLKQQYGASAALWKMPIFARGFVDKYKGFVLYDVNVQQCKEADLMATGVPVDTTILQRIGALPKVINDGLLSNFAINGAIPINEANLAAKLREVMMAAEFRADVFGQSTPTVVGPLTDPSSSRPWWQWFKWEGDVIAGRTVPFDFVAPTESLPLAWNFYVHGNKALKIRALCRVPINDIPPDRVVDGKKQTNSAKWTKFVAMMGKVQRAIRALTSADVPADMLLLPGEPFTVLDSNYQRSDLLFAKAFDRLCSELVLDTDATTPAMQEQLTKRRLGNSISTLYNLFCKTPKLNSDAPARPYKRHRVSFVQSTLSFNTA